MPGHLENIWNVILPRITEIFGTLWQIRPLHLHPLRPSDFLFVILVDFLRFLPQRTVISSLLSFSPSAQQQRRERWHRTTTGATCLFYCLFCCRLAFVFEEESLWSCLSNLQVNQSCGYSLKQSICSSGCFSVVLYLLAVAFLSRREYD